MNKNTQETRIALLEQSHNHIYEALIRIENKIDENQKDVNQRIDSVTQKIESNIHWLIGLFVSTYFAAAAFAWGVFVYLHK